MSINRRPLRYAHSEGHTDICYTEDGRQMITCGNDGDIRIWAGIDDTDPESYCVGEGAFSVAQKGDDILVCRDDGRVMVLKYPEGERNGCLTRFQSIATHIVVSKNDSIIVCVSEDCKVKIYNSSKDVDCVELSELKGPALGAALSPDDEFLAVSSGDKNIYIWKLKEKKLLKTIECVPKVNTFTSAKILGRMSFDNKSKYMVYPSDKEIIIIDTENFETQFKLTTDKVQAPYSIAQFSPCGNFIAASTTAGDICIWRNKPNSEPAISNHDQKYNVCALVWNPEEKGEISFCDNNGQVGTIEYTSGYSDDIPLPELPDTYEKELNFDDDDDENVVSLEKIKNETLGLTQPPSPGATSTSRSRASSVERSKSPVVNLQPPFQPGSTPLHLSDRFMVYNDIGIVRHHTQEDDNSSIDVQFHDATFFKNLYMKNILNHTMASLSTAVLALACETPSKLVCIPLKAGVKEWTSELSDLEEIYCICASQSLVAIATSVRMLRIFSTCGIQRAVLSIPGPVVSIAAFKTYIFVVYHACTSYSKDQNLSGMLVHFNGQNIISKILPVPITPQSTLTWVGFTDVGSITTYDSNGLLRICPLTSEAWIPAADTSIHAKGASDSYFLISVSETNQTLRAIHSKGSYPVTTPLPLSLEIPFQVPFCDPESDKSQMEEKLFRWSVFETEQPEKTRKETAIKLFALACRSNLDDQALELMEMLNNTQLINIALKYANKLGRNRLVEKLSEILKILQGETLNNENIADVSIRPVLKRKPKLQNTSIVNDTQEVITSSPDLFANSSISEHSQSILLTPQEDKVPNIRNPFLKKPVETKRNPLSLTNAFNNEVTDTTITTTTQENTNTSTVIDKTTFVQWYEKNKPELEQSNPGVPAEALIRIGMKLFKKRKGRDDDENTQKAKQPKLSAFAFSKS